MTGSIVLATEQGLGYLAKSFFEHGIIDKVFIHEHTSRKNHREWYPRESIVSSEEELLQCDTLIFFEEVWNWKIILKAREKGIKTILIPMYECTRFPLPYQPDLIITPSLLDHQYYPESVMLPIPVQVPWRLREKALTFVHNAGNGGLAGRNGTAEVIEAFKLVVSGARLILRSQVPISVSDPKIDLRIGSFDDIWSEGDVFLFPEKFNGLSLPLQEAHASGMLVMCGDRMPMNTWLPKEPLIPVSHYVRQRISVSFDSARFDPKAIAEKIDYWYGKDIASYSLQGKKWAEEHSWEVLGPKYLDLMKKN